MNWLNIFPAFRDLEARYKSQEGVIQNLQVQLDSEKKESASLLISLKMANDAVFKLSDALNESHLKHIKATETVADFGFQLKYGRSWKLFDHVPELPEAAPEIPFEGIRKSRPQARDMVAEAERKFYEALNNPPKTQ